MGQLALATILSRNNLRHMRRIDTKTQRKVFIPYRSRQSAQFTYIGFGQSRVWISVPILPGTASTTFKDFILNIARICSDKPMIRILTGWTIAMMANIMLRKQNAAMEFFPRPPMYDPCSTFNTKCSITFLIVRPRPIPTAEYIRPIDIGPISCDIILTDSLDIQWVAMSIPTQIMLSTESTLLGEDRSETTIDRANRIHAAQHSAPHEE